MVVLVAEEVRKARRQAWRGKSIKGIARDMGHPYGPVWCAVRGTTWSSISRPRPVPNGLPVRRKLVRVCGNGLCGQSYQRGGTTKRCAACTTYWYRHAEERCPEKARHAGRIEVSNLDELHKRYEEGDSIKRIAADCPFSEETLRRRFLEAGYSQRNNAGKRQCLVGGQVLQARRLVHNDGWRVCEVVELFGINYQTMYGAVMGHTWRAVGGPMPATVGEKKGCSRCGVVTAHGSGLCRFCR